MARVNRTTGIFLVLGVAALLATAAGARFMMGPADGPSPTGPIEQYPAYCTGSIDVPGGLMVPGPSIPGKIKTINVKDGDAVKVGDVLIALEDRDAKDKLEVAKQKLDAARARLASAQEKLKIETGTHQLKVIEQQGFVNRARNACEIAEANVRRGRRYVEQKQPTAKDLLEDAEFQLQLAKQERETAEAALAQLNALEPKKSLKEFEEDLKVQELEVKAAENSARENYVIKAPCDGTIVEINYQAGGQCPLPPGDAFASRALVILPNGPMIVRAELDQEWAMLVKVGQKATITVRAAGGREYTWTGKVQRVAKYMQKRRTRSIEPDQFVDSKARECVIAFDSDPKNDEVVQGMRVDVQIHTAE